MQTIHSQQEKELIQALEEKDQEQIDHIKNQRSTLGTITDHLYDTKEEKSKKLISFSGEQYELRSRENNPWLSISRGEDEYYSFPQGKNFLQLNVSRVGTGKIYNTILLQEGTTTLTPSYLYGKKYHLYQTQDSKPRALIGDIPSKDYYLFFSTKSENLDDKDTTILIGEEKIALKDLWTRKGYSSIYTEKEHNPGFSFCSEIAQKAENATIKEYAEKDCRDAVKGKWNDTMHPDLLAHKGK